MIIPIGPVDNFPYVIVEDAKQRWRVVWVMCPGQEHMEFRIGTRSRVPISVDVSESGYKDVFLNG